MKILVLFFALFGFSMNASAQEVPAWQTELNEWTAAAEQMNTPLLTLNWSQQFTAAVVICGVSETTIAASVAADTLPVANLLSEIIANTVDEDYQSLSNDRQLADAAEGLFAGAGALARDTVQYVFLTFTGETDKAWSHVKKSYESSVVIAQKMRQDAALCPRVSRIELMLRKELFGRLWGQEGVETQLPLDSTQPEVLVPQP